MHVLTKQGEKCNSRKIGGTTKQLWMMFDGKSRPWDIRAGERVKELKERWEKENGMAVGEVRLMAEGRLDGMVWQIWRMGLLCRFREISAAEWERSPGRRRRILGNRMGREFLLGLKKFPGQMVVQLKNSLKLSRKMN